MAALPGVAAVLWDMDGTLVDTEPYWIDSEYELVAEHGATWSHEQAMHLVGNDLLDSGRYMAEQTGIDLPPEVIVEELLDRVTAKVGRAVPWRPGARELLADLRRHGVRCGLVTMSYRRFVEPMLEQLADDAFEVIVTGDEVSRGKPHPEPYLEAAAALGVAPVDTLAIEDSDTGARSAEAAGCRVLVVEHHVPVEPGERRVFAPTLAGLMAQGLLELVDGVAPLVRDR
jgi:HAD superfamily hydrolase (TIGR01509 family)